MEQLTYAKAGGPPDDWTDLRVIDETTGLEVPNVIEVNTRTGFIVYDVAVDGGEFIHEDEQTGRLSRVVGYERRVCLCGGRFRIERKE